MKRIRTEEGKTNTWTNKKVTLYALGWIGMFPLMLMAINIKFIFDDDDQMGFWKFVVLASFWISVFPCQLTLFMIRWANR